MKPSHFYILLFLALLSPFPLIAQTLGSVSGAVFTPDAQPVVSASVSLKELKKGILTDRQWRFILSAVRPGTYTLRVSYTGLEPVGKTITVGVENSTEMTVTLSGSAAQLQEVVVRGNCSQVTVGKAAIAHLDLPQTIGTVAQVVIQDQQISRLGDALKNVSGVSLTQQRGGVAETFTARCYSIGIAGASGSIFKNGVITNTAGFNPELNNTTLM